MLSFFHFFVTRVNFSYGILQSIIFFLLFSYQDNAVPRLLIFRPTRELTKRQIAG